MFEETLQEYLTYLAVTGYSARTVYDRRNYLKEFLSWLEARQIGDLKAVTSGHIENYRLYLLELPRPRKTEPLSEGCRANHLKSLTGFFKWLEESGRILISPVKKERRAKRTSPRKLPEIITEAEAVKILESCPGNTPTGLRDRAILEVLYSTGIRRQELVNLNLDDFRGDRGELAVNQGKGKKDRLVPIGEYAVLYTYAYLKMVRPWLVQSPAENALFLTKYGNRLHSGNVGDLVGKAAKRSGITKKISPHTFRHSMATHLLRNGADLRHIQAILGHASIQSTEIYTHLTVEDLRQAVKKCHPHGKREKKDINSGSR